MTVNKTRQCPICNKKVSKEYRPFCSSNCKNIDLLKWLGESYVISSNNDNQEGNGGGSKQTI